MRTSSWRRCRHATGGENGGRRCVSDCKPYYRIFFCPSNLRTSLPLSSAGAGGPATPHVAARALHVLQLGRAQRILLRVREGGQGLRPCPLAYACALCSPSLPSPHPRTAGTQRRSPSCSTRRGEGRACASSLFHSSIIPSHRPTQVKYDLSLQQPFPSLIVQRRSIMASRCS